MRLSLLLVASAISLMSLLVAAHNDLTADQAKYLRMRPRCGHFPKTKSWLSIYESYFKAVIQSTDPGLENLDINDWRHTRPMPDMCIRFLIRFRVRRYRLDKPYDIIPLDACLGWLAQSADNDGEKATSASTSKAEDLASLNKAEQQELAKLTSDTRLKQLYESTLFKNGQVSVELMGEFEEYFDRLLAIFKDNPRSGCHGLWLEAYNDFIEEIYLRGCDDDDQQCEFFGQSNIKDDPYVRLILDSTIQATKSCYDVMQKQIKKIMRQAYESELQNSNSITDKLKRTINSVGRQSDAMKWGREMIRILQLVGNTDPDKSINLSEVVRDLDEIKNEDKESVDRFLEAIGEYAIGKVDINDSKNDPLGQVRFGVALTKLCRPYINPKIFLAQTGGSSLWEDPESDKKPFEFFNIVNGLIRVTNHEPIFGISKDQFEEDVIKNGWEPLYLATFTCQLMSSTWGELDFDTNEAIYKVEFRPDELSLIFVDWPIDVMLEKLVDGKKLDGSGSKSRKHRQQQQHEDLDLELDSQQGKASNKKSYMSFLFKKKNNKAKEASEPEAPVVEHYEPPVVIEQPTPAPVVETKVHQMSPETLAMWTKLKGRPPKDLPADMVVPSITEASVAPVEVTEAPKKRPSFADLDTGIKIEVTPKASQVQRKKPVSMMNLSF